MSKKQGSNSGARGKGKRDDGRGTKVGRDNAGRNAKGRPSHRVNISSAALAPDSKGRYWMYGKHACFAALANPCRTIERVQVTAKMYDEVVAHMSKFSHHQVLVEKVEGVQLASLVREDAHHQGIALRVWPLEDWDISDDDGNATNKSVVMVLDQVTDPHNVGAIIRSCAAFGAMKIYMTRDNSPVESGSMAKAASGALELVEIDYITNLATQLNELKEEGYWVVGLDGKADASIADVSSCAKVALVMGAEGKGMRRLTRERCDMLVALPISSHMESLNVSNAAAVALYAITQAVNNNGG